jgi:hypothetical protein
MQVFYVITYIPLKDHIYWDIENYALLKKTEITE